LTDIDELAKKIAAALNANALWDVAEVATYLHRNEHNTSQHIVRQPGFPRPIRIPTGRGEKSPRPLWRAKDVIAWAESYVEV